MIRTRWRVLIGVVAIILIIGVWFFLQADPIFSSSGREVVITVNKGDSLSTVAGELQAKGVIASSFAFHLDDVVFGSFLVQPGAYELRQGSSFSQVRSVLRGPAIPEVTALPGLTLHEVALEVAQAEGNRYADQFVTAATAAVTPSPYGHGASLEGLIGDKTYLVLPSETPRELARDMVDSFDTEAAKAGLTPSTTINGLDPYQLITAASIDVKEGEYEVNMPKVARVIFNRLASGMPLQMDSTVLYALGRDGGLVTSAMEGVQSPYNTYLNTGLTPTPICTVSKVALQAVLNAPHGTWVYFELTNKDGQETFSTTFTQQLAAENLAKSRGLP
ncbi:MAG: endolytic transglycosylase MltG [Acidimicrobiales bacterium]